MVDAVFFEDRWGMIKLLARHQVVRRDLAFGLPSVRFTRNDDVSQDVLSADGHLVPIRGVPQLVLRCNFETTVLTLP